MSSARPGGHRHADLPMLDTKEIAEILLTEFWDLDAPRGFPVSAGGTLTFDMNGLNASGRWLAEAALEEWSIVSGIEFRAADPNPWVAEVPLVRDPDASIRTDAGLAAGQYITGLLGSGDSDWVRISLPGSRTAEVVVEWGGGDGSAPDIVLRDLLGRPLDLPIHRDGSLFKVTFQTTGGGGDYFAEVSGASGGYRLAVLDAGQGGWADIVFRDDAPGAVTFVDSIDGELLAAEVNVSRKWLRWNGDEPGTYGFQTYLHEIGHALGLGHPGHYDGEAHWHDHAEFANDSWQTSVMSYFSQTEAHSPDADDAYLVTPMAADIEAIRTLYGAAEVRHGDTIYGHGSTAGGVLDHMPSMRQVPAFTIHDTGGHDLLDLSTRDEDQRIDLRPGAISDVFGLRGNMVLTKHSLLEDLVLGSGDDRARGNRGDNQLDMGAGDDRAIGSRGHDVISGRAGHDHLDGGSGRDVVSGGSGNDRIAGGRGSDTLRGGSGRDEIDGGPGRDVLRGGSGSDVLKGRGGHDRLSGGSGDDRLVGGSSSDRLSGGRGEDRLRGGSSDDVLRGGRGDDRLSGGSGDDRLHGGSGADVFLFAKNSGRDRIKDFDASEGDRIDLSALDLSPRLDVLGRRAHDTVKGVEIDLWSVEIRLDGARLADLSGDDFIL